jgi:hypothetical protein
MSEHKRIEALQQETDAVKIEGPSNYYGGIWVRTRGSVCYMAIENYDGFGWCAIPKSFYNELLAYNSNGKSKGVKFEDKII